MMHILTLRETIELDYMPMKSGSASIRSWFVFDVEFIGRDIASFLTFLANTCDQMCSISLDVETSEMGSATIKTQRQSCADAIRAGLRGDA